MLSFLLLCRFCNATLTIASSTCCLLAPGCCLLLSVGRFTDPGDKVVVTAFEHNPLAHVVLGEGRRLCALVGDGAAKAKAEKAVDAACTNAMNGGWFAELRQADGIVGGNLLPSNFPLHNISRALKDEMERSLETFDDDDDVDGVAVSSFEVARKVAGDHNIEIRVRTCSSVSKSVYSATIIAESRQHG